MKLSLQKLAVAVILLLASVQPAFAQSYPFPGKSSAAPVKCVGCLGVNAAGQSNANLPTWPYSPPMVNHVGRTCDSTRVTDYQAGTGFATARARLVRIARKTQGSAPPRVYLQLGSAIGIYSLDRFFTKLPTGLTDIGTVIGRRVSRANDPQEKVLQWDAVIDPQGPGSGWATSHTDGQDKLFDFDIDDRGFVYVATGDFFGWALVRDSGETAGSNLSLVQDSQKNGADLEVVLSPGQNPLHFTPDHIVAVKSGSRYYAVTSGSDGGRRVYDTTNTAAIVPGNYKTGISSGFVAWARDDVRERVAIVTITGAIEIYDAATFVSGGAARNTFSAPSGKSYRDVTVDEDGNFWTSEMTNAPDSNRVVKLERGTSSYTSRTFNVYGEPFTPQPNASYGISTISYGDKYLAVTGRTGAGGSRDNDVKIFKIEGGEPVLVDVGGFFAKYYYRAPRDYAQPGSGGNVEGRTYGAYPLKWGGKQYLIYSTQGLGDVYELQAGDSIAVAQKSGSFGTPNPNAKSTVAGPYYGDLLKFTATSSSATSYALTWNFGNSESGSDNEQAGNTGQDGQHQFSGLDTIAKIETARQVKATANVNAEINGSVTVTLKAPTARIGAVGTNLAVTTDGSAIDLVAGDQITDASDGTVEGHYSAWTLDSAVSNLTPAQTLAAPSVGVHTLSLAAKYGKYSPSFVTNGPAYTDTVSNIALTVRPFVVSFGTPTKAGNTVTFKGTARVTQQTSVLSASTWTVEWTLKNGVTDVTPPQTSSVAIPNIPDFQAPSDIPSGSILQLKVTSTGLGTGVPAEYGTHTITQTLLTPDPVITKSGCAEVGAPCAFTISSANLYPTTAWSVKWTVTGSSGFTTLPASQQFKPTFTAAGTYLVSATASTDLFTKDATPVSATVTEPACANPPSTGQISIYSSCPDSGCDPGTTVTLSAESFGNAYVFSGCEEYVWTYGDGSATVTTSQFRVTHKYNNVGNYTVRLRIKKGTQTSPEYTVVVRIKTTTVVCSPAPSNIKIEYFGNKGCQTGTPCKTTESVTFNAFRGTSNLLSCDSTLWSYSDGGSSTSFSPSRTFGSAGTHTVSVVVTNESGQASASIQVPVIVDESGVCTAPPNADKVYIDYTGQTSGCTLLNGKVCTGGEQIKFSVRPFLGTTIQACDKFEWNFGDNSSLVTSNEPQHSFVGNVPSYRVTVRAYNTSNSTGNVILVDVPFPASIKPTPVLSFATFSSTGTKGNAVTFTVSSNIPATGWTWTFGDGPADTSQSSAVGTSNTITHVFGAKGTYKVTVKARNAEAGNTGQLAQVDRDIVIDETPEYRYLIPAVAHAAGIGSVWRTDIQIYTADSSVSPSNPLLLTATYQGVNFPLSMPKSTLILEDILDTLRPGETTQGSMLISVKTQIAPQIWSRTYNQTAAGTFGQFIPAILLNETGGGSAVGEGMYYLAGLKSDGRYRTNVGLVNPNAQQITAIVRLYDDMGPIGQPAPHILQPFQLDQFPVIGRSDRPFSVEIEVPAGTWVIGYASLIDAGSGDPIYMSAIRASELGSSDYRESILPGVGHVGDWRSDITVYNSDSRKVTVDLTYHDAAGSKVGEAKNIPINAGEFLQYSDILRAGVFGSVPDGVGMLRVSVPASVSAEHFPMTVARTYNDIGSGKTYGQGIAGFASSRANVRSGKAALIPGVRSNDKYYTNFGLTNVSSSVVTVVVKALDPNSGSEFSAQTYTLQPNQSIVGPQDLGGRANASLRIEATGGNVWAYASIIDRGTKDPEYVPATPLP